MKHTAAPARTRARAHAHARPSLCSRVLGNLLEQVSPRKLCLHECFHIILLRKVGLVDPARQKYFTSAANHLDPLISRQILHPRSSFQPALSTPSSLLRHTASCMPHAGGKVLKEGSSFRFAGRERAHLNSGLSGSACASISWVDERFGKAATPPGKIEARRSLERSSFAFLICTQDTQPKTPSVRQWGEAMNNENEMTNQRRGEHHVGTICSSSKDPGPKSCSQPPFFLSFPPSLLAPAKDVRRQSP